MSDWDEGLRLEVVDKVEVSMQLVSASKAFFLEKVERRATTTDLLDLLVEHLQSERPSPLLLDPNGDNSVAIETVARNFSVRLAGIEAIWQLIHDSRLMPSGTNANLHATIDWKTPNMGAGWTFNEFEVPYPTAVVRSLAESAQELLCNHDLYMANLGIAGIAVVIREALRDAVICFAKELYTPCAAMLGAASEGVWLELGRALVKSAEGTDKKKAEKLDGRISSPATGIVPKMKSICDFYSDKTLCQQIWVGAGVTPKALSSILLWSDEVRDSRNSIHYGVHPATPNSREKLAALLLGAVPHFRTLYKAIEAAKESVSTS